MKLSYVYRFPNGMVVVFDENEEQVPELQGSWSKEKWDKIKELSDENTIFRT